MIKKIPVVRNSVYCVDIYGKSHQVANSGIINTLNKLVDAVNKLLAVQEQYETIYNEDIVPMLTPQNETPAEKTLKETFVSVDEALNTATAKELERTRKALDICVDALKLLNSEGKRTRILGLISITDTALNKIKTALEQKDK